MPKDKIEFKPMEFRYLFELYGNVKRYVRKGHPMGVKGHYDGDLLLLLEEIAKLKNKVDEQIK